jgi:hypothetical protein
MAKSPEPTFLPLWRTCKSCIGAIILIYSFKYTHTYNNPSSQSKQAETICRRHVVRVASTSASWERHLILCYEFHKFVYLLKQYKSYVISLQSYLLIIFVIHDNLGFY